MKNIIILIITLIPRVGYSIGGTAPLNMPASIRSIEAYYPTASFLAGCDAVCAATGSWSILSGIHLENKGMNAEVTTKGYRMEMRQGGSSIEGLFTGRVHQKVTQLMLTVPLQAAFETGNVTLKAGPYASLLLGRNFSGKAFDGYLRQGDPTGPKIMIGNEEGQWATYDFSKEIRHLQAGVGIGADWCPGGAIGFSADLNWGLTGLLKSSFKTVEQALFPIYGTVGIFYKL